MKCVDNCQIKFVPKKKKLCQIKYDNVTGSEWLQFTTVDFIPLLHYYWADIIM